MMSRRLLSMIRTSTVILAVSAAAIPAASVAQQPAGARSASRWFPREVVFAPLIAASREVQLRGSFVLANRSTDDDFQGTNIEAEVVVGHAFPVYEIEGGDDEFDLIVEGVIGVE